MQQLSHQAKHHSQARRAPGAAAGMVFSAAQGFCISGHAKTAQNAPRFGFFFARFKRAVFFICRAVARQMSPVNKTDKV